MAESSRTKSTFSSARIGTFAANASSTTGSSALEATQTPFPSYPPRVVLRMIGKPPIRLAKSSISALLATT